MPGQTLTEGPCFPLSHTERRRMISSRLRAAIFGSAFNTDRNVFAAIFEYFKYEKPAAFHDIEVAVCCLQKNRRWSAMMIKIFSKAARGKSYFAPFYSFSSILALGFLAGLLIIPFAIAYISGRTYLWKSNLISNQHIAFWMKMNTFREQPKVLLQENVFGLFEGLSSTTTPLQIFYSSDPYVTQQLDSSPRITTVKVYISLIC